VLSCTAPNFAATAWEDLKHGIRFLAVSKKVQSSWIGNLTALIDPANEWASVETIIKEMALLAHPPRLWLGGDPAWPH